MNIDIIGGDIIPTASAPPSTTLREKPTTPTTTTPYPVFLAIYQPVLEGRESTYIAIHVLITLRHLISVLAHFGIIMAHHILMFFDDRLIKEGACEEVTKNSEDSRFHFGG